MNDYFTRDDFKDVMGLPYKIDSFSDKKARTIYPVTMLDFGTLMENLSKINVKHLWGNFMYEEQAEALSEIFKISFHDVEIEEIFANINAGNFRKIFSIILAVNGLEIFLEEEQEGDKGNVMREV